MSMYDMIRSLPKCAMFFDGQSAEDNLYWYQTLEVKGREGSEYDIEATDKVGDGAIYKRRREKPRNLYVRFLIMSETIDDQKEQLDRLNLITQKEQVNIVFWDERDRYYVGTKASLSFEKTLQTEAVGTLELYCADPHKYSIDEYEVTANAYGEISMIYDGTFKSYPKFEATCASDLGYVSYIDTNEHVIQIGDPDEEDTVLTDYKTALISESFTSGSLTGWTANAATLETEISSYVQSGSIGITSDGLIATYSSSDITKRNGPSITKTLGSGVTAKNFDVSFDLKMFGTSVKQIQEVMVICTGTVNNTKTAICSMHITHSTDGSYNSSVYSYVMGDKKNQYIWTAEKGNKTFGDYGQCLIRKNGNGFTFMVNGVILCALKCIGTEDYEISEVSIYFDRLKDKPHMRSDVGSICTIKNFKVLKYGSSWVDVPNKFSNGDVIVADCNSGKIILNDSEQYGLGALGNDWENFYLSPGTNYVKCVYSDWATYSPTFKMKYRKVYI